MIISKPGSAVEANWFSRLRETVEENHTRHGRAFDLVTQTLIILSLASFSIETLPSIDAKLRIALETFETFTISLFTVEYVLRIVVARRKLAYILSFYGIIDLLAILPAFTPLTVDLRPIRVFRLFRLIRMLKLVRYNQAAERFARAFIKIRSELTLFFSACVIVMFLASTGIYFFENEAQPEVFSSVFSSMWWALATLTTVGYGDVFPITIGGRLFTGVILFVGLGVVAIPAGLVASSISAVFREEERVS